MVDGCSNARMSALVCVASLMGSPAYTPPLSQPPTDENQGDLLSHEHQNPMGCLSKTHPAWMDWNLNPWGVETDTGMKKAS